MRSPGSYLLSILLCLQLLVTGPLTLFAAATPVVDAPRRLLVRLHEPDDHLLNNLNPRSIEPMSGGSPGYVLTFADEIKASEALMTLGSHPNVIWAEPDRMVDYAFIPDDPLIQGQAWLETIDLYGAWNLTFGDESIVVAVIDSGVSHDHPDLSGKVLPGFDVLNDHGEPVDEVGHGTAVAGIIAARGNDGIGVAGVAMETTILPVKVGSADGSPISAIVTGIYWAIDNGADIINLSLSSEFPSEALHEAVLYAYEQGVPVITAAGNGPNAIAYPAAWPETISVGASTAWGSMTGFSSRTNRVDLIAPGSGILTTWTDPAEGDGWASVSGTSFAAPMVAGTIALLLAIDPSLTIEELRLLLTSSTIPVGDSEPEPGAGAGLIDTGATLRELLSRSFEETWQPADLPVAEGVVERTWIWGPASIATGFEEYDGTASGERLIRYYDKARMEINDPTALNQTNWFVTNGLLALEMISGQMQVGDSQFVTRAPANIVVAGDLDDPGSPTYAHFRTRLDATPAEQDAILVLRMDGSGQVTEDFRFSGYGVYAARYIAETDHQIASVFWDYLNTTGMLYQNDMLTVGRLFEPTFFVTGLPITEAYWVEVRVGGVQADVLVQCFERRCLTYTPSNPEGWTVEMGNVGRHYFTWRYATLEEYTLVPPAITIWG